jgi:hypothetical protein
LASDVRDKRRRKELMAERALEQVVDWRDQVLTEAGRVQ